MKYMVLMLLISISSLAHEVRDKCVVCVNKYAECRNKAFFEGIGNKADCKPPLDKCWLKNKCGR